MLELVNALNQELAQFAPEYVTPPQKAVYRIYRDTRFAKDKTPYKTHVSAIFPRHTAVKREGSVFYFHFTEKELADLSLAITSSGTPLGASRPFHVAT